MRALTYNMFGGIDVLQVARVPDPHPGPESVLVKVAAAGLSPGDGKIREGALEGFVDTRFPAIPGQDLAGTVVATGLDTPEFAVGDEILAFIRKDASSAGSVAEYVEVPVRSAALKPAGISFETAAALPLAGLTAQQSVRRSGISAGSTVLVHGSTGGVGFLAVQLALLAGARVIGTASPRNHSLLRSVGAEPIPYGDHLVRDARALAPDGFDQVLDFVGGAAIDATPALLRRGGTVVSVVDSRARDDFGGEYLWVRPDPEGLAELAALVDDGRLRVELGAVFELDDFAKAFHEVESGHTRGKLVIRL